MHAFDHIWLDGKWLVLCSIVQQHHYLSNIADYVGTANEYLRSNPQVDRESIIIDVALGMEYLHGESDMTAHVDLQLPEQCPGREPTIVHGDLKGVSR
jgi:hypothetical protein